MALRVGVCVCANACVRMRVFVTVFVSVCGGARPYCLQLTALYLSGMVTFLEQRGLCSVSADILHCHASQRNQNTKLSAITSHNETIIARLALDTDVFIALKYFSKGSDMFTLRFDASFTEQNDDDAERDGEKDGEKESEKEIEKESEKEGAEEHVRMQVLADERGEVMRRTRRAIAELRDLVYNRDVRINDFKLTLTGVIAELMGRRRSAIAAELKRIAQFFATITEQDGEGGEGGGAWADMSEGPGSMLNDTLINLNAAFTLERLKEVLVPFQTAVVELELLPRAVIESLQDHTALVEIMSNFLVSEAPRILSEVEAVLEGMSYHALLLVGKLTTADLLLIFLQKHARSFDSGTLDRAQHRAASNAHATGVLMHLSGLQTLLEPFYNHTLESLSEMSKHLVEHLRMSLDGHMCFSVAHLVNVCENWDEVEIYFRETSDTIAGTEDIERSVSIYMETGRFMSALSAHPGGSALSLAYQQKGGKHVCLSPEQLQARVQWAVLGGDVTVLEEFVSAFREAQRAHAIRLQLEEEGHPDHQAVDPPAELGVSCHVDDVSNALTVLSLDLSQWREDTVYFCQESPRLLLLNSRNRVQLLLTIRNPSLCVPDKLLPYIVQCFPTLLSRRKSVQKAVRLCTTRLRDHKDKPVLARAGLLILLVQAVLTATPDCSEYFHAALPDDEETCEVTRLDLVGFNARDVYCQHVSYMVSQTFKTAMPGMVLWGERATTEREVQDLLLVASAPGLAGAVHVVGVDQLTPRIREVLLRGIENTALKAPLLLIFGDRDGVDTFSQYESEGMPEKRETSAVRPHLWCYLPSEGPAAGQNAEVWVVCGKSGMGKSRWIDEKLKPFMKLKFSVHEGFSPCLVINRLYDLLDSLITMGDVKVSLIFDVHTVGCVESFSRFLHHLLALGLIIDDESGSCFAILPCMELSIFVELPEIAAELLPVGGSEVSGSNWPPLDDSTWNASQHPLLRLLPALATAVQPDHYVSIRIGDPFIMGYQAELVARYLHLARDPVSFETSDNPSRKSKIAESTSTLKAKPSQKHKTETPANVDWLDVINTDLFNHFNVNPSKKVRYFLVRLLHDRFLYFRKMRRHIETVKDSGYTMQDPLEIRLAGGCYKVLLLFIREALDIAAETKSLPDTTIFTIRPVRLEEFEVLVSSNDVKSDAFLYWSSQFMETKGLVLTDGTIPPIIRGNVAPAFGMEDTSGMISTLQDCGHLLTPESLVRILDMHSRRLLGASVIYEGETGVGKSQNLKLYSLLINSNNSLFANLKLHLIAVITATAKNLRHTASQTMAMEEDVNESAIIAALNPWSSLAEVCSIDTWLIIDCCSLLVACRAILIYRTLFPLSDEQLTSVLIARIAVSPCNPILHLITPYMINSTQPFLTFILLLKYTSSYH
jgi:hypothetical protein